MDKRGTLTPIIKRVVAVLFVLSITWLVEAETTEPTSIPVPTLKRREGPKPERCEDYVARTRHTYFDTAQVMEDAQDRRELLATYNRLGKEKLVLQLCTQPKFLVWYDLDRSMVELQRQYAIMNKQSDTSHKEKRTKVGGPIM